MFANYQKKRALKVGQLSVKISVSKQMRHEIFGLRVLWSITRLAEVVYEGNRAKVVPW
jgi:hypothetical protein